MKSLNNYTARVQAAIIALFLIIAIFSALSGNAQATVKQTPDGNYIAVKAASDSSNYKATGKYYEDAKGERYPVFISKNGKLFINRISRNTLKPYRQYLKTN